MKTIFWIFFFCIWMLCVQTPSVGQKKTDTINGLIELYNQSLANKDKNEAAVLCNKIGFSYWKKDDLTNSKLYFNKAAALFEELDAEQPLLTTYISIGMVDAEMNEYNEALKFYQKALKLEKNVPNKNSLVQIHIEMAAAYKATNKLKRALNSLEEALPIALELDDIDLKITCYRLLMEYNKVAGNGDEAKEFENSYNLLNESVQNKIISKERSNKMALIEGQLYQTKAESEAAKSALLSQADVLNKTKETLREVERIAVQKQLQVNLLNTEKELKEMTIAAQEANLKTSRIMRNSFIVGFILVSGLVVIILLDVKKKKAANAKIHEQHLNIASSINYAQRIQQAMLPKNEEVNGFIEKNTFILFKPRDVVSGDFYWFKRLPDSGDLVIAAVDCTGHGVPGAFMSMIGMNTLNSIVTKGVTEANEILDELHQNIRTALSQKESGNNDGMDMSLCIIREKEKRIDFAGAKNPLVYIQNNEIFKVKADAHPIGGGKYSKEKPFTKHTIEFDSTTMVYLFSDGYQDQFGGPDNMKFMTKNFRQLLFDIHLLPLDRQKQKLDSIIEDWKGSKHQTDDILVIGMRLEV